MEITTIDPPRNFLTSCHDPLFHLITTNDSPTLEELNLARERIGEVDEALVPLQSDIKALERQLDPLRERKEVLAALLVKRHEELQEMMGRSSRPVEHASAEEFVEPTPEPVSSSDPMTEPLDFEFVLDPLAIESVDAVDMELASLRSKRKTLESQLDLIQLREESLLRRRQDLVAAQSDSASALPAHIPSEVEEPRALSAGSHKPITAVPTPGLSEDPETPTRSATPDQGPSASHIALNPNPPTPEELQRATENIDDVNKDLRPLRDDIHVLESQLSPLREREEALLRKRQELTPVLSPWRRLPAEILSEIMQEAVNPLSPSFLSDSNTSTDRREFKGIRSVCRLWRDVAFATYSLWTSVYVDFDLYPDHEHLGLIRGIETYFSHSGPSLPLNLGFQWRAEPTPGAPVPGEEGYAYDAWLDYLTKQRFRWEELSFFTHAYHFQLFEVKLRKELELGNGGWKTLFLQISARTDTLMETPGPSVDKSAFQNCFPVLETINLSSQEDMLLTEGGEDGLMLLDGHTGLRKLRLDIYTDMNPYFSKLGGFPNLKKLLLNCPKLGITAVVADAPTFELPSLELLVISCIPSFAFLSKLRTPSLRTLQILTNIPPSGLSDVTAALQRDLWSTFPHIINFIGQCDQKLREVHMNCWFMPGDDGLRRLLESLSSVEKLCIDTWFRHQPITNGAETGGIDSLEAFNLQNSTYLPKLRKLCVHPLDGKTSKILEYSSDSEGQRNGDGIAPLVPLPGSGGAENSQTPGGDEQLGDGATAGYDAAQPFARGQFSWPSLNAFLDSAKKRRREGETLSRGSKGLDKSDFLVCIPDEVTEAAGKEATSIVKSLKGVGLNVEPTASCRIFW